MKKTAEAAANKAARYETEVIKIQKEIEVLKNEYEKQNAVLLERLKNGNAAVEAAKAEITLARSNDLVKEAIETYDKDISAAAIEMKDVAVYEAQQKQRKVVEDMKLELPIS